MLPEVIGNPAIQIVQGDSYALKVTINKVGCDLIKQVIFTSNTLGVQKDLILSDGIYILYFSREDTAQMKARSGNYDLTVVFTNNKSKTIIKNAPIKVIEKNNKVNYNG